ncbi:DUF4326 domain-containing protein [Bradyrhizobium sp. WSM 1738]|uniref:DUF4326 domain-containing protein n=1 Tax=Bradyrhizobium hereditatis TaxID=2821405 RepID=UPI001CE350C7|nr:DUF4326 domain-containing protein [Bradyrhizobium hereditatis]MCA6114267.1 DUF4326 domain-containing protein [Bradyrhizobium hereditatis]
MPQRIQRKRTRGWKMPPNTVYVGRPGLFGNPLPKPFEQRMYQAWLCGSSERARKVLDALPTLRGKNLACWCKIGEKCHADVLLELANR